MLARIGLFFRRLIQAVLILAIVSVVIYAILDDTTNPDKQVHTFDHLHYDVVIKPDGSADVHEIRTYTFRQGQFSFAWFDVDKTAEKLVVMERGQPYTRLQPDTKHGQPGQYGVQTLEGGDQRVTWYYEAEGPQSRTFEIRYRIPDVAVAYSDCVVYFQKYLSEKNETEIERITVSVYLPDGLDAENTLIWAHGPVNGTISFADDHPARVDVIVEPVPLKMYIEARFLFPAGSMPQVERRENQFMYDAVYDEETKAAKLAIRNAWMTKLVMIFAVVVILVLLLLLAWYRYCYRSAYTRRQPGPVEPYRRTVPRKLPLPVVAWLNRFYKRRPKTAELISLTILDLIRTGNIKVKIEGKGRKQETLLQRTSNDANTQSPSEHEAIVLDFLFQDAAEGSSLLDLKKLSRFCSRSRNRSTLSHLITEFDKAFKRLWNRFGYEETRRNAVPKPIIRHRLVSILAALLGFLLAAMGADTFLALGGWILLTGGLVVFLANLLLFRKRVMLTQKGEDERESWQALERFFREFSTFDEKELPEVGLWAELLLYAAPLCVADRVMKQLRLRYPDDSNAIWQHENTAVIYGGYGLSSHTYRSSSGMINLHTTVNRAMSQAQAIVTQSRASTGSGGGFSGGGSSGGGGAGGSSGGGVG
jgi:uncharacterized membrane protein